MQNYKFKIVSVRHTRPHREIGLNRASFIALLVIILAAFVHRLNPSEYALSGGSHHQPLRLDTPPAPHKNKPYSEITPGNLRGTTFVFPSIEGLLEQSALNLNMAATFTGTKEPIACRHLSLSVLRDVRPTGEVDLSPYSSKKAIEKKISINTEASYKVLRAQAPNVHMIENQKLGHFVANQFIAMSTSKTPLEKTMVTSAEHAMGLWLTITHDDGKPVYGVHFYDPNRTVIYKSITYSDIASIKHLSLNSFIEKTLYNQYYAPRSPDTSTSVLFLLPETDEAVTKERHLTRHTKLMNSEVLYSLLEHNFPKEIQLFFSKFAKKQLTSNNLALLAATGSTGTPGLHMALHKNNKDTITAYIQGIHTLGLSEDNLVSLLAAKRADAVPGLLLALENNHKDAISAYIQGIHSLGLSEKNLVSLLAAKKADDIPGLYMALQNNHQDAITAYIQGIHSLGLSEENLVSLLAAKLAGDVPGLQMALQKNNKDAITAYIQGIHALGLSEDNLVSLLAAKTAGNMPGLLVALNNNHKNAITAYLEGIKTLALSREAYLSLVGAKATSGVSGILMALHNNQKDAITAYFKGLKFLGISKQAFLASVFNHKAPGISMDSYHKNTKAAYFRGLKSLT